ncbi:MAG: hypothetical protein Q9220_007397 [cf. Caloplaca sp. 1 TL-2023]
METFVSTFGAMSATVHGLIVSSILIPAAVSSFFAGRVADILGRPKSIAIGTLLFGIGAGLEAGSIHIAMFVTGRVIEGIGEGLYLGTLVVYICEISPPRQRGRLMAGPQLGTTLGLVVGFFTCYGSNGIKSSLAWRMPFIVLASLSALFAASAVTWLPPSPRWLILQGRQSEASAAWAVLGIIEADREKLEVEMKRTPDTGGGISQVDSKGEENRTSASKASSVPKRSLFDAFASDVRSRTVLGIFLLFMQQLSGIDGVLYYAPLLFTQAGLTSSEASFLASGVSGIVIFAVTIPALLFADQWGRRHSTIYGGIAIAITMFLIGGLYAGNAVQHSTGAGRWVVIVTIYLYAAIYCVSWGVGMRTYVAESQPQRTRASAANLAYGSNWVANFLVALTTPVLLARSSFAAYFLFGGCTLLTAVVCFFFMPETKGHSLGQIEEAFRKQASTSPSPLKAFWHLPKAHAAS